MSPASRKRSGSGSGSGNGSGIGSGNGSGSGSGSGAMKGATSARTAAIQAVERRRRQEEHDNPIDDNDDDDDHDDSNSNHNHNNDSPPPLLEEPEYHNDDQHQQHQQQQHQQQQQHEQQQQQQEQHHQQSDDSCLHCHRGSADIQVRCDECQSYICQTCHWCHEFQANHEIRVCDRCDAFYCRTCDEMDQCDDCGEVVCASCSTLLSCKFCGGGLCEECATACGRCGIVLCSRDAKFAVDCDTCRLSYCLVCLASGSKDPCVRCGHRPSKRMEQLVHLRLKSIYKAFKQSSRSPTTTKESTTLDADEDAIDEDDVDDDVEDTQALLQAAATAASSAPPTHGHHHHHHGQQHQQHGQQYGHNLHGQHGHVQHSHHDSHSHGNSVAGTAGGASNNSTNQAKEMVDKYMAEKKRADAAAEALLTELEEEEQAVKSKKSKKKKKKQRQQQAKKVEEEQEEEEQQQQHHYQQQQQQQQQLKQDEQEIENDLLAEETTTTTATTKPMTNVSPPKPQSQEAIMPPKESSATTNKKSSNQQKKAAAPTKKDEQMPTKKSATNSNSRSSSKSDTEKSSDAKSEKYEPVVPPSPPLPLPPVEIDPVEKKLCALVEAEDVDGIEDILHELKGVVGRSALRKNAKKALKRLRPTENDEGVKEKPNDPEEPLPTTARVNIPVVEPGELLKVVSENSKKVSAKPAGVLRSKAPTAGPPKAECVMQMSPAVVGWVIGKGGQRIRDLMEESGAKIWIDQDNMKNPHDPRTVYVSGARKCVDRAVRLVKDLVAKAPLDGAAPSPENEAAAPPQAAAAPVPQPNVNTNTNAVNNGPRRQPPLAPPVQPNPANADTLIPPVQLAPPPHLQTGVLNDILGTPQRSDLPETGVVEHILTCDPRFVPLLIGRRGWTIKHIQDSSGARVDIDQTVTPRRIKISGSEKNVETAIQMVRDVLSYPHAQLQAGGGMEGIAPLNDIQQQQQINIGHSDAAGYQNLLPTLSPETEGRYHTPPPSSLIMTGDSKSAISASSSLSSTPEPSMAPSSKLYSGQLQTGLMTPHDYGANNYQPSPAGLGNAFLHHDMSLGDMSGAQGPAGIGPNGTPVYGGGHIGMHQNQGYGMRPRAHPYGQTPGYKPAVPLGANVSHEQHPGGLEGMPPRLGVRPDPNSNMHQTRPLDFSGMPRRGNPAPLHQQNAFGSSSAQFRHQEPLPDGGLQNMMNMGPGGNVNHSAYNPGPDPAAPSGLWNRGTCPSVPGRGQPEAADGFYVDPLRQQNQTVPGTNPLPLNFDIAPNVGDGRGGLATGANPLGMGRDDSLLVDSLFGPTTGNTSGADQPNLLTGFQGLSIHGGESLGGGVWGSSLPGWEGEQGNTAYADAPVDPVASTLFSGLQPLHASEEQQHPAQSRFHWGSTNA